MAIQIRRGSNAEWEVNNSNIVVGEPAVATDSKRAFIGTASGAYMELANLEAIAPAYDPGNSYMIDDYVSYQGKLYVCTVPTSGAWNASAWQVTSLGQALAENAYSNYETYTMSGNIVSFPNGAGGIPVKDLKADVEAVQDLNGYDYPWVGGAGKNLLPMTVANLKSANTSGTWSGNNYTYNNVTFAIQTNNGGNVVGISVNGTANANTSFTIKTSISLSGSYILNGCPANGSNNTYLLYSASPEKYDTGSGVNIEYSSAFNVYIFIRSGYVASNLLYKPMIRLASITDATFEPYENICPISGWDEVNANVRGKNFLEVGATSGNSNGITWSVNADGSVTVNGTATATVIIPIFNSVASNNKIYLPQGQYKLLGESASNYWVGLYINKTSGNWDATSGSTFTVNKGIYVYPAIRIGSGTTLNNLTFHPQIRLASETDATYEPYNGQTYTTDLDGTRYGGTLDVTTGVLTVTHWGGTFNNLTGYGYSNGYFYCWGVSPNLKANGNADLISSIFKTVDAGGSVSSLANGEIKGTTANGNIFFKDTRYTTTSAFLTDNGSESICFKLATPQTYQLSPQQVRTVLGQNNIWADSGEVEVTYRISNVQ